ADPRDMARGQIRAELDDDIARVERKGQSIGHKTSFCLIGKRSPYAAWASDASPYSAATNS
ncbi:MAG: hypothetical protein RL317_1759, partial [Pseudomonadota bacterium]